MKTPLVIRFGMNRKKEQKTIRKPFPNFWISFQMIPLATYIVIKLIVFFLIFFSSIFRLIN